MKLMRETFTQRELDEAAARLATGSPYEENKFHPEDDAKTARQIMAECMVIEQRIAQNRHNVSN